MAPPLAPIPPVALPLAPPAGAASLKVPESGFFAVRHGAGVRSCIFLRWSDCWGHLSYPYVDYKVFDDIKDAIKYVEGGFDIPIPVVAAKRKAAPAALPTATSAAAKRARKSTTSRSPAAAAKQKASPAVASTARSPRKAATMLRSTTNALKRPRATTTATYPTAHSLKPSPFHPATYPIAHSLNYPSPFHPPCFHHQGKEKENKMRSWESNFSELKCYMEDHASKGWVEPTILTASKHLILFVKDLPLQYNMYKDGNVSSSTLTEERIKQLQDIGFVFVDEWEKSFNAFKSYREANGGEWVEIDKGDAENKSLRRWIVKQQEQYKRFHKGEKDLALNQKRIDKLKAVEFQFDYIPWSDRVEQLKSFKAEHGHLDVPTKDHELSKWMMTVRRQYAKLRTGKTATQLTAPRLAQLSELGLHLTKQSNAKLSKEDVSQAKKDLTQVRRKEAYHVNFDVMLPQLEQYKKENGDCKVPGGGQHKELAVWLQKQRLEYSKLRKGDKNCRLTANHIQRLTDTGFQIGRKDRKHFDATWEEHFQELLKYKEKNGDTLVPQAVSGLGPWVHRQRKEIRLSNKGEKSALTEERASKLTAIGFVSDSAAINRRSWEERFQEFLEYKEKEGHPFVPFSMAGLGSWMHEQRKEAKRFRKGEKSTMTEERVARLTEAGFVFDGNSRKRHLRGER